MPKTFDFTQQVAVRLTDEDLAAFKAAADDLDMSVAEFLRAAALLYLCTQLKTHGLKALGTGIGRAVKETIASGRALKETIAGLRERGLRKVVFGER